MSLSKPVKEAAAPKTEEKGQGKKALFCLRTKPDELPEIKHNCWMEWEDILLALKEYFRLHFQDMESICPDQMRITELPAYVIYELPRLRESDLAGLTEASDPYGIRKQTVLLLYRSRLTSYTQKIDKQLLDKGSAYRVIRSMCSPQLNAILIVDPAFIAVTKTDPLGLLDAIKGVVTSRCDGNIELERAQALRDWYTLTMRDGEDIVEYGRRSVKLCDRLTSTGVPEAQCPSPKAQSLRFIDGLSNSIPTYYDYKNYLSNSLTVTGTDIYPTTLVAAINSVTKFHRGAKSVNPQNPSGTVYTTLAALEDDKSKGKPRGGRDKKNKSGKGKPAAESSPGGEKDADWKSKVTCHNCGKLGHIKKECRGKKKEAPRPPRTASAAVLTNANVTKEQDSFYSTFGQMFDKEDDYSYERTCNMILTPAPQATPTLGASTGPMTISLPVNRASIQPITAEVIFDTGATGSIVANRAILTNIASCRPTEYKGLNGSLTVTKVGKLGDIGIVHFDPRAKLSIISASDCWLQGHHWEFRVGDDINDDAFLLHTTNYTYRFKHRNGLYIANMEIVPEPRHLNAPMGRFSKTISTMVCQRQATLLYSSKLTTTAANEALYSKREVQRSAEARRLQASLGFPPDNKFIAALNAGSFLNCTVIAADVRRATAIWGPQVAALKGRTTKSKPMPPPQEPPTRRSFVAQHMHCDIMYVNKKAVLVSKTEPVGVVLCACIDNVSAPILRQSIRKFFGTFGSRGMSITRFTSDNERGLTALFGDMNGMGVHVVTVGPGQHAHVIERTIRTLKETIRTTIYSLPYKLPDAMMPYLIISAGKKLLLFPSVATRTDGQSAFQAMEGRNIDLKKDVGPPFGSYCEVDARSMTNGTEPRTKTCLYLDSRMNGTGTHMFMTLDTQQVISANHYVVLPITDIIMQTVNSWAAKNKIYTSTEPTFTFHERDITHDADDDESGIAPMTAAAPLEPPAVPVPLPPVFSPDLDMDASPTKSPRAVDPSQIGGGQEPTIANDTLEVTPDEVSGSEEPPDAAPDSNPEADIVPPANVRTRPPKLPIAMREPSTRVRKPTVRFNLTAALESTATLEQARRAPTALMSVTRGLKMFKELTTKAIESEVKSLLAKNTFEAVDADKPPHNQRKRTLRSIMNVVEKYLPTLDPDGNRAIDKVKARLCVDGRGQDRDDYRPEDIESPTANISSIFTVAQIAAAEQRFVMVGDVGSAYLNAAMPTDNPDKILYMLIEPDVSREIIRQDKSFLPYQRRNGSLVVRLNKALYGCIESAKLWYIELAGTLTTNGFTANPRDICIFNKDVKGTQITIVVYVDDLMMTSRDKQLVLKIEQVLRDTYGQFRTSQEKTVSYLGCTWDFHEKGFVKVSQAGMIQDLVASREKTHENRGTDLTGDPVSPGAPYLFNRTPDAPLLSTAAAKIYHTDVATALYLANRTRPTITLPIGELCRHVKEPTVEDDRKLDRVIAYLRHTRDVPLRLGCDMPPRVTVSIDAAFANRENMKSTSGMCVTLGVGNFISSSKIQKLNSKSSTEAEIIAVSDGMNIPLWLADFLAYQGYEKQPVRLEQDNQSCIALLNKGRSTAETTRFIEVRKFWISDYIRIGAVEIVYVPTEDMTSDFFTKPVQGSIFAKLSQKILGN